MTTTDLGALYAQASQQHPGAVASTYPQPTDERTLTQAAMETVARRSGVQPVLVPGGHNAHVAHPEPIAEAIDAATTVGRTLLPEPSSHRSRA